MRRQHFGTIDGAAVSPIFSAKCNVDAMRVALRFDITGSNPSLPAHHPPLFLRDDFGYRGAR